MTLLADRYELLTPLASGGMAQVWRGRDSVLGREVAIKVIRDDIAADPNAKERLLREARAAAGLVHPNAVTVFDTGEHDGQPFIVMELVNGPSLAEVLRNRGPLEVAEAVGITDEVLAALEAAHDRHLVHRDVKPGNVLLAPDGRAKLADFGIAKGLRDVAQDLTATGQVLGTPRYLSPEQVAGEPAGPASDQYAVGVLVYEMLAGHPPFSGPNAIAVALAHQGQDVPSLQEARPEVEADLAAIVHRALEKDPQERFASAGAMRAALSRAHPAAATVALDATTLAAASSVAAPASAAADRTTTAAHPTPEPARSRWPLAVVGVVATLLLALAVNALLGGGDEIEVAAGPSPTPPTEAEPVGDEPANEEPPAEPEPEPERFEDLGALIAFLAQNPGAAGEKHKDLREKIIDVLDEEGGKRASEARKLADETEKWIEKGELDPEVGQRAIVLLNELAADEESASGRDRAQDRDDNGDDDDDEDDEDD